MSAEFRAKPQIPEPKPSPALVSGPYVLLSLKALLKIVFRDALNVTFACHCLDIDHTTW